MTDGEEFRAIKALAIREENTTIVRVILHNIRGKSVMSQYVPLEPD